MRTLAVLLAVGLAAGAQGAPVEVQAPPPADWAPLLLGQSAPFTGNLLKPATFQLYLTHQLDLELCQGQVQRRDLALQEAGQRSFIERHGLAVGLVLGFAGAIALTWGTVKVLATTRNSP